MTDTAQSDPPAPAAVQFGPARFTVITPQLIRLEYSRAERFTDEPSLFAIDRQAGCDDFQLSRSEQELTITTAAMTLTYRPDGKRLNPENLSAEIAMPDGSRRTWRPGDANEGNLKGPLHTLDGVNGEVPCPQGLLSRDGWQVIDDSDNHLLVDGWVAQRPPGRGQDWYLFGYGLDYKAALRSLTAIGGPVPLPRKHVFGSWYCRWYDYTSDDYRQLVAEYEQNDFPLDIMVFDMGWHRYDAAEGFGWAGNIGWSGWSWNRDLLPDVEDLLAEFRDQGLFVSLNVHPHDGIRDHEDMYDAFMADAELDPDRWGNPPFMAGDRKYMDSYFQHAHAPHEAIGVDFWWVDWQQNSLMPYVWGVANLEHQQWLNHLYFQHTASGDKRGLCYSRWGGWGDHRYPLHFSGDCHSTWEMLEWLVPFTAFSSNAGLFFWAHDLGGFMGKRNAELFARWVQFGVASPSLRVHSIGEADGEDLDRRPWLWGEQATDSMRQSYHLRARLMPYIYSCAYLGHAESLPLVRPMYLEYPDRPAAYENSQQFLFGPAMLAAPIASPGEGPDLTASQKVWFPEGTWYDWFTGERYEGDATARISAPLDRWPLLVRAGVPIPTQPYTPRMATEPLGHLIVRCYSGDDGAEGRFDLYEDDGQSRDYLAGRSAVTPLSYRRQGQRVTVTVGPTTGEFYAQLPKRDVTVELPAHRQISDAACNGRAVEVTPAQDDAPARVHSRGVDIREALELTFTAEMD